ncbi:MAG TPA: glycoside hydrolase family 2 TIM barrel-domain containing protein [Arachidicoccus sp.]|nr:glycoside hydrolase family 2 TIM barrel-domain containing protein [Arachidicoccus sp.]
MMRYFSIWATVLLFAIGNFKGSAQSDASITNRRMLFDYNWRFQLGDQVKSKAAGIDFNDKTWRNIDLPHDWSIEGTFDAKNPMGTEGGYLPAGIGWYRKTFRIPEIWKGKLISIYFEGVYMNAEVFINGRSLGVYPYGYTSFYYDLTPYLNFNKDNVIAVRVDNAQQKNSRWYTGSGIYRHVWLEATGDIHIAKRGVGITTTELASGAASVQVVTTVKNETNTAHQILLSTALLGPGKKLAGNGQVKVDLAANSEKEVSQVITITKPELWSPSSPHLYNAKTQIAKDNQTVDELTTQFGIRSLEYTAKNGFRLNGQSIKLFGGCVHHDNGALGAAAYDRAEVRKVQCLKSAGFNAVRTSHNPPSPAFLNACDRLGIFVIDEAFDGWRTAKKKYDYALYFDKWAKRDIEAMVMRDRNHPSIVMWSTGNEIIERKEPQAVETAKMLTNAIKKIDSSRPVTSAMTTWDKEWEIFDPLMAVFDVAGYNYQLHRAVSDHQRVPSRIIVQTESYPRDAFANWKLVQANNYIIGDFVWTAMDYLGESGIGRWYYSGDVSGEHYERDMYPWHGAYCGDIDLTGWRKPISHYRSMLYNNDEKIYMAVREPNPQPREIKETLWSVWPTWESWTWPGFEGKDLQVEVYSKFPSVRLYLNKKLIAEKATTENEQFKATFTIPYAPGELRAVGVVEGREVAPVLLKTAGKAAEIRLIADRKQLQANGQDLSYVSAEIIDKDGNILPNAENRLFFKIAGPGVIAGVDNADLKDTDPYVSDTRKVWKGRALAIIKSARSKGDIRLKVSSAGLPDATIMLRVD